MFQFDNSEAAISLRAMKPADVTILSDLWVVSWSETFPDIDFDGRRDWLAACLGDPRHETLVAEDVSGLVGFVTLQAAHLHQLVVAPRAKGGAAARHLTDAAKGRAPAGLTLDVNQDNPRAVRFYAREGFAIIDAGRNPGSGLPTWRMAWRP